MPQVEGVLARSRRITQVGAGLVLATALGALLAIIQLHRDAVDQAESANHQLGAILAEQTERAFQATDIVLRQIVDQVNRIGFPDEEALREHYGNRPIHERLLRRLAQVPQVSAFAISDAQGRLINATGSWPPPAEVSIPDRPLLEHLAATAEDRPSISAAMPSPFDGSPTIFLQRPLRAPDGTLIGVVSGAMRRAYFEDFYRAVRLEPGMRLALLKPDATLLAHSERLAEARPLPAHDLDAWQATVARGGGQLRMSAGLDGPGARFVAVHRVEGYPLVVHTVRLDSAAFAQWQRQAWQFALGAATVLLGFWLVLSALRRQLRVIAETQERLRAKTAALQRKEEQLQTTFDNMEQGILLTDPEGRVTVCNRRLLDLLDLPEALMARHPTMREVVDHQIRAGEFVELGGRPPEIAAQMGAHAAYERRRPNGTWIEIRSRPLPGGGMVRTYTDITARAAAEEMLGLAASHDQLTGLANRNGFQARLEAALAAAQRGKAELAVLCLDLDRFKVVNDTLGHEAGDALLVQVAQRMRALAREGDVLARLGGDEFAVVLPATRGAGAEAMAQRLMEAVREPYTLQGETARIGVSIGIACYPADGGTAEILLRHADRALYQVKESGRNGWRSYASEAGQREHLRMALERDLHEAVGTAQMSLVFQPICDVASLEPVTMEALLRWTHPRRGPVPTAEFIPIAERTGLIIPLGRWAMETACAEAAAWASPVRVAVNLSPAQFRDRGLLDYVDGMLARTGLPAGRLELEVTEGLLLEDTREVVETMQALRRLGVRMVLDDFGTAHSNLSYLRGFPFDAVKIDRSFMRALNSDRQARALVEAMLAMARALGLEVVSEGVETAEQLALLRHLRCERVQGYLLGHPADPLATRELLWQRMAGSAAVPGPVPSALPPRLPEPVGSLA